MATMDWLKYGKDFSEVNKNLNGLPEWLKNLGQNIKGSLETLYENPELARLQEEGIAKSPSAQWARTKIDPLMQALGTGAANMFTGGLSGAVRKIIAPKREELFQKARAEHPVATGIGQGAGLAGAVLAPMGAAGAGLQLGPAGAGLGSTLARNALLSSAYAVPAAGAEAMETGNIPRALLHGGINTAAGTILGTAGEKLIPAIQRLATNARLRGWGLRATDINKALRGGAKAAGITGEGAQGMAIKNAKALREQLDDLVLKFGAGPKGAGAFSESVSSGYKNLGELYDKAGVRAADMLDDILKDSRIVSLKADLPQMANKIDDEILNMASRIDRTNWRNAYSGFLTKEVQAGRLAAKTDTLAPQAVRGQIAQAFKDQLGSVAEAIRGQTGAGQSLADLNSLVGPQHAVKGALGRSAAGVGMGAREGSQTSPRLLAAMGPRRIAGATLGMAGAAGGQELAGGRPRKGASVGDWLKYGGTILGSGLLGGALGRGGARMANAAASPILSAAANVLPLATGVGRAAGAMGAALPAAGESLGLAGTERATPLTRAMTGEPEVQEAAVAEAQATPAEVQQAKQVTNEAFGQKVAESLKSKWGMISQQVAGTPWEISFDEFLAMVRQATNDFDPKVSAGILFPDPDERARYLKTYESALMMQKMDLAGAFGGTGGFAQEKESNRLARQTLENYMVGLLGGQEKMADPKLQELVSKDIEAIRRLRLPVAAKQEALRKLLQVNYGIDFDMLNQYGVSV